MVLRGQYEPHERGEKHTELQACEADSLANAKPFERDPLLDVARDNNTSHAHGHSHDELSDEENGPVRN